jgi:hypothetical protein
VTGVATKACETSAPHAAFQELPKLAFDERRDAAGVPCGREKRREVLADDAVEHGVLGGAGTVRVDRSRRRALRVIPCDGRRQR